MLLTLPIINVTNQNKIKVSKLYCYCSLTLNSGWRTRTVKKLPSIHAAASPLFPISRTSLSCASREPSWSWTGVQATIWLAKPLDLDLTSTTQLEP